MRTIFHSKSYVLCKTPKAGLGNQLFPLLKAFVFGQLNQLDVIVTGYNRIKLGPYLRGEKSKRKYAGNFRFQRSSLTSWMDSYKTWRRRLLKLVVEPALKAIPAIDLDGKRFLYTRMPDYFDFFLGLNEHRSLVKKLIPSIVHPSMIELLDKIPPPCIGVHVRMGDFRKLAAGEDFSKVGQVRTPEQYFIDVVNAIRTIHGSPLPVSVFSNGYQHELPALFALKNVNMVEGNPDLVDLLLLSRSRIIVTSSGSTFSYWSGFLSDVPIIMHPDHIYKPIRHPAEDTMLYEGPMNPANPALVKAIKTISYSSFALNTNYS